MDHHRFTCGNTHGFNTQSESVSTKDLWGSKYPFSVNFITEIMRYLWVLMRNTHGKEILKDLSMAFRTQKPMDPSLSMLMSALMTCPSLSLPSNKFKSLLSWPSTISTSTHCPTAVAASQSSSAANSSTNFLCLHNPQAFNIEIIHCKFWTILMVHSQWVYCNTSSHPQGNISHILLCSDWMQMFET